ALEADTRIDVEDLVIEQNADDGTVVLDGRVGDISVKRLAANAAWQVVRDRHPIEDRLRVRGRPDGDLALRDEVIRHLTAESMFSAFTVVVEAGSHRECLHDGGVGAPQMEIRIDGTVVTLEGSVPSLAHRRFAE